MQGQRPCFSAYTRAKCPVFVHSYQNKPGIFINFWNENSEYGLAYLFKLCYNLAIT